MCSCEPGFVCRRCAGTPFDPNYAEDDPPPLTGDEFDALTLSRPSPDQVWLSDPSIR